MKSEMIIWPTAIPPTNSYSPRVPTEASPPPGSLPAGQNWMLPSLCLHSPTHAAILHTSGMGREMSLPLLVELRASTGRRLCPALCSIPNPWYRPETEQCTANIPAMPSWACRADYRKPASQRVLARGPRHRACTVTSALVSLNVR